MLDLFSIPDSKLVDFKVSLLSGIYSGLVVSLFFSVMIPISLNFVKKASEKRKTRLACEEQFSIFIEKLEFNSSLADNINPIEHRWLPEKAYAIINLIFNSPLKFWMDNLPKKYKELFEQIINTKLSYTNYQQNYNKLNSVIFTKLTESYNPRRFQYNNAKCYILGRINGLTQEEMSKWVTGLDIKEAETIFKQYKEDNTIAALIQEYSNSKQELLQTIYSINQ